MCLIYVSTIRQISAPIIWDICLKMGRHAFPFIPSKYNMGNTATSLTLFARVGHLQSYVKCVDRWGYTSVGFLLMAFGIPLTNASTQVKG